MESCFSCLAVVLHVESTNHRPKAKNGNRLLIACTQRAYHLWDLSLLVYRWQDTIRTKFLTKSFIWVRCVFVGPPPSPHITVSNVCNTWRKICAQARHLCYSWTINPGAWEISCAFFIVHRSRKDQKKGPDSGQKKAQKQWWRTLGLHTFWPDFWAVLWTLFSCFGSRDIVFSWGMWRRLVHVRLSHQGPKAYGKQQQSIAQSKHTCSGCHLLVRLSGRRTPYATRLACAARQVHSPASVCPPVCLSIIAGSLPPQPL